MSLVPRRQTEMSCLGPEKGRITLLDVVVCGYKCVVNVKWQLKIQNMVHGV